MSITKTWRKAPRPKCSFSQYYRDIKAGESHDKAIKPRLTERKRRRLDITKAWHDHPEPKAPLHTYRKRCYNGLPFSEAIRPSDQVRITVTRFAGLIKRIDELEQRLAQLEAKLT